MRKYKYSEQTIQDVKAFSNDDEKIVKYALESDHQMLRDLIDLRIKQYSLQVSRKKDKYERMANGEEKEQLWQEIDELQDRIFLGYDIIEKTYDAVSNEVVYQMHATAKSHGGHDKKKDSNQKFGHVAKKSPKDKTREK